MKIDKVVTQNVWHDTFDINETIKNQINFNKKEYKTETESDRIETYQR